MWTKTIERGPYRATILEEQTMGTLERFHRVIAPGGLAHDEDPAIFGFNCMRALVAVGVISWERLDESAPEIDWPSLDGEAALERRMEAVQGIPTKLVKTISDAVNASMELEDKEAGN